MTIRTGIVGAGIVSQNNHLPAVARNPRTELVGVCDADEERASDAAAEYGTAAYTDAEAFLDEVRPEWVHVATPVSTHAALAGAAIDAGAGVLLQKPATTTVAELEELIDRADDADVPFSVVHNWLYYPVVRELRAMIEAGALGELRSVEVTFAGEGAPDETYRGDWVFDLPGGDFGEGIPHPLYLALGVGGFPRSADDVNVLARATRAYEHGVTYDGTQVQYRTEAGALCSVTYLSSSARRHEIRVHGAEASATVDVPTMSIDVQAADEGPFHFFNEQVSRGLRRAQSAVEGLTTTVLTEGLSRAEDRLGVHTDESTDGHYYLIDRAARAIEAGEQPPVDPEQSRWVQTLTERVREAAADERGGD